MSFSSPSNIEVATATMEDYGHHHYQQQQQQQQQYELENYNSLLHYQQGTPTQDWSKNQATYNITSSDLQTPNTPTQTISRQQQRPPKRPFTLKVWFWEIISVILTIGLIIAIVVILDHYEGRTLPDWPLGINLNTLVALLATFIRTLMLVTVAEVLGQMKWDWFSRSRSLDHIAVFDRASRGILGSLRLLVVAPMNGLVVIACIVTILSLAIGPFTQQAVSSVNCQRAVATENASVPIAHFMGIPTSFQASFSRGPGAYALPVDMKGVMVNGLVNPTGSDTAISPTCQTGNCTFEAFDKNITYSSIGMCSKCIDTTSYASLNKTVVDLYNTSVYWDLPIGMELDLGVTEAILNVATSEDLNWAESSFTDDFILVSSQAVSNITVFSLTREPCTNNSGTYTCPRNITNTMTTDLIALGPWDLVASSCALYPCLKNYHGDVDGGVFTETVISTELASYNWLSSSTTEEYFPLDWTEVAPGNWSAVKSPCVIDGIEYTTANNFSDVPRTATRNFTNIHSNGSYFHTPEECVYTLSSAYIMGMYDWLSETFFTGSCVWPDDTSINTLTEPDCSDQFWLSPFWNDRNASFESISRVMDEFSTAITNSFRTSGMKNWYTYESEAAEGVVNETTVCVAVNWEWLLMPIILTGATVILLIMVIVRTAFEEDQPVWKTSVLPLLFYGLGQKPDNIAKPAVDLDQLQQDASKIKTKFANGGNAGFISNNEQIGNDQMDVDSLMGYDPSYGVAGER